MSAPDLALPNGARLLHVGPFKTGTTALQAALQHGREELARQGVFVPERGNVLEEPRGAITADPADPTRAEWLRLVARVEETGDRRAVVSSEYLSDADPEAAARIIGELGGDRVHIVITLRPLVKLLPSSWSQLTRHENNPPYEEWLRSTLEGDGSKSPNPMFWHRQRHGELVERWAAAAGGPERVTVIVVDESDKDRLRHGFEDLLGLTRGTLQFRSSNENRSFTAGEAEFIRQCWDAIAAARIPNDISRKYFKRGAIAHMKSARRPERHEPRITTPKWAQERAAELSVEAVEHIRRSGVRVIGDLNALHGPAPFEPEPQDSAVAPAAAALAMVKVMQIAQEAERARKRSAPKAAPRRQPPAAPTVDQVPTAELLRVVGRRVRRRLTGR